MLIVAPANHAPAGVGTVDQGWSVALFLHKISGDGRGTEQSFTRQSQATSGGISAVVFY